MVPPRKRLRTTDLENRRTKQDNGLEGHERQINHSNTDFDFHEEDDEQSRRGTKATNSDKVPVLTIDSDDSDTNYRSPNIAKAKTKAPQRSTTQRTTASKKSLPSKQQSSLSAAFANAQSTHGLAQKAKSLVPLPSTKKVQRTKVKRSRSVSAQDDYNDAAIEEIDDFSSQGSDSDQTDKVATTKKSLMQKAKSRRPIFRPKSIHQSSGSDSSIAQSFDSKQLASQTSEMKSKHTDILWTEKYTPRDSSTIALHNRKYKDVKTWLELALSGRLPQRVLVLAGPPGSSKTAAISVLARELDFDIVEWTEPPSLDYDSGIGYESMSSRFAEFLAGIQQFGFAQTAAVDDEEEEMVFDLRSSAVKERKKVVVIEDIPSAVLTNKDFRAKFVEAVSAYIYSDTRSSPPLIFIISEIDQKEDSLSARQSAFTADNILGREIMSNLRLAKIQFNPVNMSLVTRSLKEIAVKEGLMSGKKSDKSRSNAKVIELISTLAELGDIRSAINALQMWAVSRGEFLPSIRDSNMEIFHAVGKVIYNKTDNETDPNTLIETISQSVTTSQFIGTVFENYPPSCPTPSMLESCSHQLSDADLFYATSSSGFHRTARIASRYASRSDSNMEEDLIASIIAARGVMNSLPPQPISRIAVSIKDFVSPLAGGGRKRNWSSLGGKDGGSTSNQICMPLEYSVYKRQSTLLPEIQSIQATRKVHPDGDVVGGALSAFENRSQFMTETCFWSALIAKDSKLRRLGGEYSITGASNLDLGNGGDNEPEAEVSATERTAYDWSNLAGGKSMKLYISDDDIDEDSDYDLIDEEIDEEFLIDEELLQT
ncbi:Rad17 cell cycle checkpoint protein-domain-containing protein [Myxozyma melibiosi]|uniref:Rad17 cell cycle checkpoint protein-domain-containing protein n=1 Tax=Myxozyma melibiosi TaxID=54550 RepID=A0ABR1FBV1_9ASCO